MKNLSKKIISLAWGAAPNALNTTKGYLDQIGQGTGLGRIQDDAHLNFYGRIANIINIVLGAIGVVAVIYIIYAGVRWIKADGNDELVKEAKEGIRSAIIGLLVVFSAFVISNFVIYRLISATTQ